MYIETIEYQDLKAEIFKDEKGYYAETPGFGGRAYHPNLNSVKREARQNLIISSLNGADYQRAINELR